MKTDWKACLDLALAMVIVGSSVVVGKIITTAFPLFLASGMRFAVALAALIPLVHGRGYGLRQFSRKDWLILVAMSFSGQFVYTLFVLWGLRLTSSVEAGLILSTTPAAMAAVAYALLKEKLSIYQIIGVCLAVLGVAVVSDVGLDFSQGPYLGRCLGNLLICLAVFGEALFLLQRKTISPEISSLTVATALCLIGFLMFLPLAIYQAFSFDFSGVDAYQWGSILYFGVVYTVVAYILWFRGVARVSGGTAGIITAVMPISAVGLSYIFLGESFKWSHLMGGFLVLAAIGLMTRKTKK